MDIAFWGGVASLITFAVMLGGAFFKGYKWINEKITDREKYYAEIRAEIHLLASKATTQGKRQDLFIIINGRLNNGRNRESLLRWAILTSLIMSILNFDIAIAVMPLVKLGAFYWFVLAETIVSILGLFLFSIAAFIQLVKWMGANHSLSECYYNAMAEHLE